MYYYQINCLVMFIDLTFHFPPQKSKYLRLRLPKGECGDSVTKYMQDLSVQQAFMLSKQVLASFSGMENKGG